jgi:hypothetical protein
MSKDDPAQQSGYAPRALWLDHDNMTEARDNWFRAYEAVAKAEHPSWPESMQPTRGQWDIAWAAAIAAFSYMLEGRTGPAR